MEVEGVLVAVCRATSRKVLKRRRRAGAAERTLARGSGVFVGEAVRIVVAGTDADFRGRVHQVLVTGAFTPLAATDGGEGLGQAAMIRHR